MADTDPVEKPVEEAKETTKEVTDAVTEPVAEVVPEEVKEPTSHPENEIPPWGKELTDKVDSLIEQMGSYATAPVEPDPVTPDETPVDMPWTHKPLFGRKG